MSHTFIIYHKQAPIISSRSLHVTRCTTVCVPEAQRPTWSEAWERYDGNAKSCGVDLNPLDYVAVRGEKTGRFDRRGAEVLRVNFADAVPVCGPCIRRTRSGAYVLRGRSTRRYSTLVLAQRAYARELARIAAVVG